MPEQDKDLPNSFSSFCLKNYQTQEMCQNLESGIQQGIWQTCSKYPYEQSNKLDDDIDRWFDSWLQKVDLWFIKKRVICSAFTTTLSFF